MRRGGRTRRRGSTSGPCPAADCGAIKPEERARIDIDRQLAEAVWTVQDAAGGDLEDLDSLPEPDVLAEEIAEDLRTALEQQAKLRGQARETPRHFVERESHYLWGRRYLLSVKEEKAKPSVRLNHRSITLTVRHGSSSAKRAAVMHEWHKSLLHEAVPELIRRWEPKLGVEVAGYFLQRMKTKWGSCNHRACTIRLNTELVKKPRDLLEYVMVHEMLHLIEPTHSDRFLTLMSKHYPAWREARAELSELPLGVATWRE